MVEGTTQPGSGLQEGGDGKISWKAVSPRIWQHIQYWLVFLMGNDAADPDAVYFYENSSTLQQLTANRQQHRWPGLHAIASRTRNSCSISSWQWGGTNLLIVRQREDLPPAFYRWLQQALGGRKRPLPGRCRRKAKSFCSF